MGDPELRFRLSPELHAAVKRYARGYGISLSQAARDLLRRQLRYLTWVRNREGKGPSHDTLRHYGRIALDKKPDATKSQVAWHIAKRSGKFPNVTVIDKIAEELVAK